MDRSLHVNQIDDWIAIARTSLLTFWRGANGDFWRDSDLVWESVSAATEQNGPPPDFFSTNTYMAATVLLEPGKVPWEVSTVDTFSAKRFLEAARSQFDKHAAPGPEWSAHTASWAVKALRAASVFVGASVSGSDRDDWLDWIRAATKTQAQNLTAHLQRNRGATLSSSPRDNRSHGHPLFTAHALSALRAAANVLSGQSVVDISVDIRKELVEWARTEVERTVAQSVTGIISPRDLLNLPYHALTLCYLRERVQPSLLAYIIKFVCQHQIAGGGWPLLGTEFLSDFGNRPFRLSSFEIGSSLLRLSTFLQEFMPNQIPEEQEIRRQAFQTLFDLLRNSFVSFEANGKEIVGWTTNHAALAPAVETGSIALALRFLKGLRHFTQSELQDEVLGRYDTTKPFHMKTWVDWEKIDEPDLRVGVKSYIERYFLTKIGYTSLPSKEGRNVSMILFGPPGTSKTTLAKAVAKKLHWPMITVTPSLFLSTGPAGIDSQATRVFSDLRKLQEVVVLFDECDELFRARSVVSGRTTTELDVVALITGAMLPRLQDLHDRGGLIFILATNRIDAIDSAVRRQGRFDHLIAIGPPDRDGRERLLLKKGIAQQQALSLSHMLDGLTRDEILDAAEFLSSIDDKQATSRIEQMIRQRFGESARAISKTAYEEFQRQREMLCSAWRNAQTDEVSGVTTKADRARAGT